MSSKAIETQLSLRIFRAFRTSGSICGVQDWGQEIVDDVEYSEYSGYMSCIASTAGIRVHVEYSEYSEYMSSIAGICRVFEWVEKYTLSTRIHRHLQAHPPFPNPQPNTYKSPSFFKHFRHTIQDTTESRNKIRSRPSILARDS